MRFSIKVNIYCNFALFLWKNDAKKNHRKGERKNTKTLKNSEQKKT